MPQGQKSPETLVAPEPVSREPRLRGDAFYLAQNLVSPLLLEKAGIHVNDLVECAGHVQAESEYPPAPLYQRGVSV